MASKQSAPTRTSSRTKPVSTMAPPATRATRTRAATTKPAAPAQPVVTAAKKTTARKPLVNRENSVDLPLVANKASSKATRKPTKSTLSDGDREPIMAYLRIRPQLGDDEPMSQPYLTPLSDTAVRMTDPHDPQSNPSRFRPSTLPPSSIYTFSHVFPSSTSQSDFFTKTTLPLVRDVLQGQNGLLFTYGVTNSGKTYTVQGGTKEGSAGILPRTLDVVFNSIEGLHGDGRFRPVRLHGVEPAEPTDSKPPPIIPEPALAEVFGQHLDDSTPDVDIDPTVLKVDRNYEYTIWISYAEVYNEKIYDLLASVKDDSSVDVPRAANGKKSLLLTRTALSLKPSPTSDNADLATNGRYISGLRQFRVHSASQAKALVKLGQLHRRVFGTLANRESSRSHGMVIIKVVRGHRGEKDDPTALQISRLTLVDLAGSERTKHTHTTGDRLKEAGNINKSLMVLGQCMEVMRANQRKLAMSLSQEGVGKDGRMDTRDVKKGLAIVPFRHSKLTEALMDYFIGDGRAVMIVNVNPYDTGYDENSHVMKFAALAREIYITPAPAPIQRLPNRMTGPGKTYGTKIKELGPLTLKDPEIVPNPYRRKVTISIGGGRKPAETTLEVLEEDEPEDEEEDESDGEPINPLVDALFDEVENLRMQLFEAEMRCAIIEADTREEVMHEMEARMLSMEAMYSKRLMRELEQNEMKIDAKIDMLHQSGLFGSPVKNQHRHVPSDLSEEEEDVEMSLVKETTDEDEADQGGESPLSDIETDSTRSRSVSPSPLAKKGPIKAAKHITKSTKGGVRKFVPENEELTETDQGDDRESTLGTTANEADNDDDFEDDDDDDDDEYEEEEHIRPPSKSSRSNKISKAKTVLPHALSHPLQSKMPAKNTRVSKIEREMEGLSLGGPDDSVIILPVKKYGSSQKPSHNDVDDSEDDDDDTGDVPIIKKKRKLGKKPIVTEEQIEKATIAVAKSDSTKNIRRLGAW